MSATAVDLFAGAGGMSLGLGRAGFDVRTAFDNWGPAIETYNLNFAHPAHRRDVATLTGGEVLEAANLARGELDLLAGGPPCQGFSIQRIGSDVDARNDMVLHFARLVTETRPRLFLMENVPGLLGMRGRHILTEFERMLHDAGYTYEIKRVDAADFGVPQSRRRVLFVGWRRGDPTPATDFATKPRTTVREAFADLPPAAAAGAKGALDPLHITSRMSALNVERLRHIPPGGGFEDLPVEMRVRAHKNGAAKIGHRAVYGRLHPDRPAGVITARFDSFTRGRFAHPIEDRNITLREGARLQSFPDDFAFLGNREEITALIGNAVPPKVAESVGAILRAHLGNAAPEGGVRPASLT